MDFGRILRSPFVLLTIALVLMQIQLAVMPIYMIRWGRGGTPYDADRISSVTVSNGTTYGPFVRIPADYFRCWSIGELSCSGDVLGERLRFKVRFNGSWKCEATHGGQPISCRGGFGSSDDIRTANVTIAPSALGLTNQDLASQDALALVGPDKPIRPRWLVLGALYALVVTHKVVQIVRQRRDKTLEARPGFP